MRITGGTARGRSISGPKAACKLIRPTSDRVREALFNIIAAKIANSRVLDLYAGTGAFGLESLSRGAAAVVFVDQARQALELIENNLSRSFARAKAALLRLDLAKPDSIARLHRLLPPELRFELIFLDPPYEQGLAEKTLKAIAQSSLLNENLLPSSLLAEDGLLIAEEHKNVRLPEQCARLRLVDQRSYGETSLWLYQT
jgi:16S rRNA (guanine966-N2)-methyltransferase